MLANLPPTRYSLTSGGYCYGQQLESKSRFICGFSQKVNLTCGHHTTSNSAGVDNAFVLPTAFVLPNNSLSQDFGDCKYLGDTGHFYYPHSVERKF